MPPVSDRPNVIVFFTDQQRWDTTGVHGNPLDLTPNFDAMARRGTHVANAFTAQPVCAPSRSTMQTGQYATTTGVYRNGIQMRQDTRTLAHHFNDAGYATGYIGKWHLAAEEPVTEPNRGGYQFWLGSNALEFTSDAYRCELYNNENELVRLPGYRVDAMTDAAIRFVNDHRHEPFYLFLSFLEPHHQNHRDDYPAPHIYEQRYMSRWTPPDLSALGGSAHQHLAGYYGMVRRLDEALGRLLDALESLDLSGRTIVLFTSDHGCHFKTRNAEYKRSCHESSIHVPMALQGPGFDGGGQLRQLVSLVDVAPTLLEAAGLDVSDSMQGRSIMPLLRDPHPEWPDDVFVQISESQTGRCVRTQRWKYSVSVPLSGGKEPAGATQYNEEFLYDLMADPYELTNLIGLESHQDTTAVLRDRLVRRMTEAGEAEPEIVPAPSRKAGQRRVSSAEARA